MRRLHVLLAALLLLPVVACGDDGGDSADGTTSSTAAGDTGGSEEAIPLNLTFGATNMAQLDVLVAVELGLFEEEGLDVPEPTLVPNSPQQALAAAQGDVDVAVPGISGLFGAVAADRDLVAIATGASRAMHLVVISKDAADELAEQGITPDSPIEDRVEALADFTIATSAAGGSVETLIRSTMSDFGVDPTASDQFVAIADVPAVAAALQQGQIDAAGMAPPDALVPVASGDGVIWINLAEDEIPSIASAYYTVHVARTSWVDENPDAVERYVRAIVRADQLIADADPSVIDVLEEFYPTLDRSILEQALDSAGGAYRNGPASESAGFEAARDQYDQTAEAAFPGDITFEDVFRPQFAEEAMGS